MTPKEKAKELYEKYYRIPLYVMTVKQCAMLAVEEIINQLAFTNQDYQVAITYWTMVKQELESYE
jgi:hypothetical protein